MKISCKVHIIKLCRMVQMNMKSNKGTMDILLMYHKGLVPIKLGIYLKSYASMPFMSFMTLTRSKKVMLTNGITWRGIWQHISGQQFWQSVRKRPTQAPAVRKMPGKPTKNRIRKEREPNNRIRMSRYGMKITCNICYAKDHNKGNILTKTNQISGFLEEITSFFNKM